jgi:hypothetical protein
LHHIPFHWYWHIYQHARFLLFVCNYYIWPVSRNFSFVIIIAIVAFVIITARTSPGSIVYSL